MKSKQVYSTLREQLAPIFKANGFARGKTMLSWLRPQGELFIGAWCQVSQDGWDDFAGSKFVFEFQLGYEPVIGSRTIRRERIGNMLSASDRETVRGIQNRVIDSLQKPPKGYALLNISDDIRSWYLDKFQQIKRPYSERDDIWLRYRNETDVSKWAQFLVAKLPELLRQVQSW